MAPMINNLIQNQPEELYFTKNFQIETFGKDNIKGYHSNNFLIRIGNSFTTALNNAKIVLPSAILIILDNAFLKDEVMADQEMPKLVYHILNAIHETIKARKKLIGNAYWEDNQPKVILLRPLPRPAYSLLDPQKHKALRRLYAQHIEKITERFRVTLLNVDELNCSQRVLFNQFGNLSAYGVEKFWKSISDYFRRSDRDEYYAVKTYRTPKRTVGIQTFTQQSTSNNPQKNITEQQFVAQSVGLGDTQHHYQQMQTFNPHGQAPYQYQHGVNDHYHFSKY